MKKIKKVIVNYYVLSFALGLITASLLLDGRGLAMFKAFNAPEAVNGAEFTQSVEVKK